MILGCLFSEEEFNSTAERNKRRAKVTQTLNLITKKRNMPNKAKVRDDICFQNIPIDWYVHLPDAMTLFAGVYNPWNAFTAEECIKN